jgi:hypothetical protein
MRSIRVLEKLKMTRVGEVMFDGYDYPDAFYALKRGVSQFSSGPWRSRSEGSLWALSRH